MERNLFVHFGPNTFSGREWGDGTEAEDMFNPTDLDCRQWARTAKEAGFRGIIITAKHHDGFCLWPNPVSRHTVRESSWMDGKGDVLRELSDACREYGLKFGIYISPWDRNDPSYGTPQYNDVFVRTLQSALGSYGPVFEQWFDGANGEGPSGRRQQYDWPLFNSTVYSLQPDAVIFSDVGPGCRWCGNEEGHNGRTSWSTLDAEGFEPGAKSPSFASLNGGDMGAAKWIPAETNTSIRPGWFFRESENTRVKTLNQLLGIFYESVGRNSLLLLNIPPDTRGHFHEIDSVRVVELGRAIEEIFSKDLSDGAVVETSSRRGRRFNGANMLDSDYDTYWAVPDGDLTPSFTIVLPERRTFNRISLQEYIPLGQRVSSFSVEVEDGEGLWREVARETTIGFRRIVLLPEVTTSKVRVGILSSLAPPVLNRVSLYMDEIYVPEQESIVEGTTYTRETPLLLDLGEGRSVSSFTYTPSYRGEGGVVLTYDLEASLDGRTWTRILEDEMFDNIVNNPVSQVVDLPSPCRARYLRLVARRTSNEVSYGASEFSAN